MAEIPAGRFSASASSAAGAHFGADWGWDSQRSHERKPHGTEALANPARHRALVLIGISNGSGAKGPRAKGNRKLAAIPAVAAPHSRGPDGPGGGSYPSAAELTPLPFAALIALMSDECR